MREILFRAKRIDNGEWVEGYYIYHIKRTLCPFGDSVKPEDEQHVIMQDAFRIGICREIQWLLILSQKLSASIPD